MKKIICLFAVLLLLSSCGTETDNIEKIEIPTETKQVDLNSMEMFDRTLWHGDRMYMEGYFEVNSKGSASIAWMDSRGGNDCWAEIFFTRTAPTFGVKSERTTTESKSEETRYYQFFDNCSELHENGWPKIAIDDNDTTHLMWSFTIDEDLEDFGFVYLKIDDEGYSLLDGTRTDLDTLDSAFLEIGKERIDESAFALDSKGNPHIVWESEPEEGDNSLHYIWWDGKNWRNTKRKIYNTKKKNSKIGELDDSIRDLQIKMDKNDNPIFLWVDSEYGDYKDSMHIYRLKNDTLESVYTFEKIEVSFDEENFVIDMENRMHISWVDDISDAAHYVKIDGDKFLSYDDKEIEDVLTDSVLPISGVVYLNENGHIHILKDEKFIYARWDDERWFDLNGESISDIGEYSKEFRESERCWELKLRVDIQGILHIVFNKVEENSIGPDLHYLSWSPKSVQE